MFKIILVLFVLFPPMGGCNGGDFGSDKHTIPARVVEIGVCGESFPSYTCSVTVVRNGNSEYWKVDDNISVGQTVYKHCWMVDNQRSCFVNARTRITDMYR